MKKLFLIIAVLFTIFLNSCSTPDLENDVNQEDTTSQVEVDPTTVKPPTGG